MRKENQRFALKNEELKQKLKEHKSSLKKARAVASGGEPTQKDNRVFNGSFSHEKQAENNTADQNATVGNANQTNKPPGSVLVSDAFGDSSKDPEKQN